MTRILHVTECFEGGVGRAIDTRVLATPEHEHHLLWAAESNPEFLPAWQSTHSFHDGIFNRTLQLHRLIQEINPDVIHAHSSWAGLYTRILPARLPIVYEPHCFKFDDPSISPVVSQLYYWAERILSYRTRSICVLSEHERKQAASFGGNLSINYIPNVPTLPFRESERMDKDVPKIIMVGRLANQKDPEFFVEVVNELRTLVPDVVAVWVGDGDQKYHSMLSDHSIAVTGWIESNALSEHLDSTNVYIHTAKYEGFPLSILDAATRSVPIVARQIPALEGTSLFCANTPKEIAQIASSVLSDESTYQQALHVNKQLLQNMNVKVLRQALLKTYANLVPNSK